MIRCSECTVDLESNLVSLAKIKEYFNIPQESLRIDNSEVDSDWEMKGYIKFLNFSNKYREESEFVLKNINFEIMPKEIVNFLKFFISLITFYLFDINTDWNYRQKWCWKNHDFFQFIKII